MLDLDLTLSARITIAPNWPDKQLKKQQSMLVMVSDGMLVMFNFYHLVKPK